MKTAKRLLSVLLILVMVFALVACGGDPATTDTNTGSVQGGTDNNVSTNPGTDNSTNSGTGTPIDPKPIWVQDPYDKADFEGNNYIILQHSQPEEPFGYGQDSLLGASVADRIVEVQNTFGCTLEFKFIAYGNTDFVSAFQALVYTENSGDIIYSSNNAATRRVIGTGGDTSLLVDLLALDNILNFWDTNKWGNITSRETMMAGSSFYGLTPALWVDTTPLPYYQVVYRRDMLDGFGATDPQEYWENEEWDRDAMLDVIEACYDDTQGDPIYGMSASIFHMTRATFLTTGSPLVVIDKINEDESVDWSHGLLSDDAVEALQWLKNTLTTHLKHFNGGKVDSGLGWSGHEPLVNGQAAMCITSPSGVLKNIVVSVEDFGLTTWAGADANVLSGYYENCHSVSIPVFAQDPYQSAYIMYELFEGMDGIETYEDVIDYYRNTYFATDLDVTMLLRDGATLQYSYWPNGIDSIWTGIYNGLMDAGSVKAHIEKNVNVADSAIETYLIPNAVELEKYRQAGFFK